MKLSNSFFKRNSSNIRYIVYIIFIILLWNTFVLYPFRLYVVFWHELCHGLMAILTGGEIHRLLVEFNESGLAYTRGGNRTLILLAGYTGTAITGALMLLSLRKQKVLKIFMPVMGIMTVIAAIFWIRDLFSFFYALLMGGFFLFFYYKKYRFSIYIMEFIAFIMSLYSLYDILDLYIGGTMNDATMLAQHTGIPLSIIVVVWTIVIVAILYYPFKNIFNSDVEQSQV